MTMDASISTLLTRKINRKSAYFTVNSQVANGLLVENSIHAVLNKSATVAVFLLVVQPWTTICVLNFNAFLEHSKQTDRCHILSRHPATDKESYVVLNNTTPSMLQY